MTAKPQNFSVIKKSKETAYPEALIVIETEGPIVAEPFPKQTIQRYWYDDEGLEGSNKVTKETLLTLDTPESFIVDL